MPYNRSYCEKVPRNVLFPPPIRPSGVPTAEGRNVPAAMNYSRSDQPKKGLKDRKQVVLASKN